MVLETTVMPERPRRGLLDVLAFAGAETLAARAVAVAVGKSSDWVGKSADWWVQGSSDPDDPVWREARLRSSQLTATQTALPVTWHRLPSGVFQLSTVRSMGIPTSGDSAARYALVGEPMDGWSVLILVEGPQRAPQVGWERCLRDVLEAAEDAVSAELDGNRQRLRAVLQEREEERRRWARELHDETLQQLGALQVLLTSARRSGAAPRDGEGSLQKAVDVGVELLAGQITSLRHLITELRPAALDELGLRAPLQALAERTEALSGIRVEVEMALRYADGEISTRLLPDIEVAVYRVVQEALTNAARHSRASRARVSVLERDERVIVEVSDDGVGLTAGSRAGFGLRGMKERAVLAGGRLEVLPGDLGQPQRGGGGGARGTLIRMVVPATHRVGE